jgi:hypothetical protein
MKTGVYQTNISHPSKATEGGWDILFTDGVTEDEAIDLEDDHWHSWAGILGKKEVWIRPLDIRQPWTDNGDGTFTLTEEQAETSPLPNEDECPRCQGSFEATGGKSSGSYANCQRCWFEEMDEVEEGGPDD